MPAAPPPPLTPDPGIYDAAMVRALAGADEAAADGDVPVGAVMLGPAGETLVGRNRRERDQDPSAHAEIVAMRAAADHVGRWRLDGWTCVVTLEPCPMCAGALVNARVDRVVFGCRDPKAGAVRTLFELVTDRRLNHRLEVVEGVRSDECAARLTSFFAARRRSRP